MVGCFFIKDKRGIQNLELIDKFIKFEYEEDLFNKEIQGVKFWHYIRFSIYDNEILKRKYNLGQAHSNLSGKKFITKVWYKLKQIPNFILRNPLYRLDQRDILVLNHQRRVKNGKYYDCIYTDKILENIKKSYYVFEEPYLEKHFRPIRTKNIRYFDYINFIKAAKKIFFKFINQNYGALCSKDINELYLLFNAINKVFNVNIEKHKAIKDVENLILNYKISKKYYEKILNKIKPKIIIEIVSYSYSKLLFNEIAKERGIKTIELQHGFMGKYHIAYNFYRKLELETFPEYIFLFGDFWKSNKRFPLEKDNLIVTGFPYFESKLKELTINNRKSSKKENILFISGGDVGKQLSKLAIELDKLIDHKKYNIIYKLHPGEYDRWKRTYPWLVNSTFKIVDNNKKDIYYFLNKAGYLIGVTSTVIFEGLGFNLKIFVYKIYGYKYMEELYENNYAQLITSADDIINQLNNDKKNIKNKEFFWKSNSLKNIINNIKNICDHD